MGALAQQIQEILLLQSSLLPGEVFQFILSPSSCQQWQNLLDGFNESPEISFQSDPPPPARFVIKIQDASVWFEINFSSTYPDHSSVSVKGNLSKDERTKWISFIEEKTAELYDSDYPTYQLISSYLLPLLNSSTQACSADRTLISPPKEDISYHALLTSHHLVSPNKRRSLQQWSSSLSIRGFAKVGHPGVIYAQGLEDNIHQFVRNIKSMQWLALRVRFVEPLTRDEVAHPGNPWLELEKVGEVVEYMRLIGREEYVVDMGIGSAGLTIK